MKRPVGTWRMMASSSQLSHRRRATSTPSAASAHSSSRSAGSLRPKARASAAVVDTAGFQAARPRLTQSSDCRFLATWNGSVWVVVTTGARPIVVVRGPRAAATVRASSRPEASPGSSSAGASESAMTSRSNPASSAWWAMALA